MELTQILIALGLIAAGAFLVIFLNKDSGSGQGNVNGNAQEELTEEEKAAKAAADAEKAREALMQLEVPGNIPEIAFYFGSQTGTAEKFCSALDEDASQLDLKSKVIDFNDFTEEGFPDH